MTSRPRFLPVLLPILATTRDPARHQETLARAEPRTLIGSQTPHPALGCAALFLLAVGCATGDPLMPTPNLYADGGGYPQSRVAATARDSRIDLLYVTDRAPETVDHTLTYSSRRSASSAFGSVIVEIGEDISWNELVEVSGTRRRERSPDVRVRSITELGRFPPTPRPFRLVEGVTMEDPGVRSGSGTAISVRARPPAPISVSSCRRAADRVRRRGP